MPKFAGISELTFYPLNVNMAAVAATEHNINMRPRLGSLAILDYTPTEWRYLLALSAAPTTGNVTIALKSDGAVVASEVVALSGNSTISNRLQVPVSAIAGEARLSCEVDVTAAADAGITGVFHSVVSVEQPVTLTGC